MIHSPGTPKPRPRTLKRVLAIDPNSRGFGFAVLEGPDRLIDWGVVHVRADFDGMDIAFGHLDRGVPEEALK